MELAISNPNNDLHYVPFQVYLKIAENLLPWLILMEHPVERLQETSNGRMAGTSYKTVHMLLHPVFVAVTQYRSVSGKISRVLFLPV